MEGGEGPRPPATPATFEREQLDQALSILDREAHLGRVPPAQRRWFRWCLAYGYSVPVVASGLAVLAGVVVLAHAGTAEQRWAALVDAELRVFVATVLVFGPLNVLAAVCLFPVSAPLLFRTWRWRRRMSAAGLSASLRAPWERRRARNRLWNALTLGLGPWLAGWGLLFVLLQWLSDSAGPVEPVAALRWVPLSPAWVLGCALYTLPIGLHYLALHFLLRDMERVAVVHRLILELRREREHLGAPAGEESVLLGSAFREAARIEGAQIARERLAVLRRAHDLSDYQVRRSADFRAALAPLEDARQLRVHDLILRLADRQPVLGMRAAGNTAGWVEVPDTDLELCFELDDARRELTVLGLRGRAGATRP